jgi:anti-sigma B factor antagonist
VSATSNHDVVQRLGLTDHQLDRVKVLEVAGELDLWTAPTLCERIEQCLDEPLLVDLTQLQFCDSTGLRALHGAVQEARIRCARIALLPPQHEGAAQTFRLAGAPEFLPLAADLETALDYLASSPSS